MTQPTNVHVPGPLDDDDTQKAGKDIKTGQRVSWSSSGGTARGIVRSLHRDGAVPGIPVKITGTEEEPAARIELIDEDGKPRGQFVGHKLGTLRVLKAEEVEKAEYQGEQVSLNKPFRLPKGSSKKFGVYVKDGDKVKRVTFGDPNMEIRRDDAQARANFRSRHSCDTATDKTSARYWSCRMWEAGKTVSETTKRQMSDDSFTTREEAMARSYDLGFEGEIHTHETADGQRVFMPGATHDAYLGREADDDESPDVVSTEQGLLERTITAIMGSVMEHAVAKSATILKADEETRMVYGWASVATVNGELVVDQQGDTLEPSEMVKMADGFMASVRTAKAMHQGAGIGEVLHSMPLTNDIMKAFGISCDREGWLIAMKIHDDAAWARVKSGDLAELSIGGRAGTRERIA